MDTIRVGVIGFGANTRLRHSPVLLACPNVTLEAVCNRSLESAQKAAQEYNIAKVYESWQEVVEASMIDAICIGTWPYLHCPITLAALENWKHVLTVARMAMDDDEARQMYAASQQHPELVTQIVPSPLGMRAHKVVKQYLDAGEIGELREVVVWGTNDAYAHSDTPLHWRQSGPYSGINMLALGIIHEPLVRWIADPVRVVASTQTFTPTRHNKETGKQEPVGTPDSVQVITELPCGARGIYHMSGVIHHGPGPQIHLYGSEGTLKYVMAPDNKLYFGAASDSHMKEVNISEELAVDWRVEEEFINAIRGIEQIEFNNFAKGVRYMEFTKAVEQSALTGQAVDIQYSA
ncbi:MAG: Gfo/Idh/MocA family oxidoreductase [Pirellulales bacterium]|nr:Gfo/Idh/MocA family oxidoreductase [Pirellulales bacterium]